MKSSVSFDENTTAPEKTLWHSIKHYRAVVWCCVGLISTILLYGYDSVIVGASSAMPSFQIGLGEIYDFRFILPSLWLGLWQFATPAGAIIGSVFGGQFQDLAGRRWSLVLGSILSAMAVGVMYATHVPHEIKARRAVFLGGKAFQGVALGIVNTSTQTYMSEILPPSLRGPIMAFFPMFTMLGQLIGAGVVMGCLSMPNGYTICFASQWPFSVLPIIVAYFIPESPVYLVRKGQMHKALSCQQRLEPADGDAETTLNTLQEDIEHESTLAKATYIDCFKRANLRRTLIVMFASSLPQLFGLGLISKSSYFAQVVGLSVNTSIVLLLLGISLGLVSNAGSVWILHHVGRRKLWMWGLGVVGILWLSMGISGIWHEQPTKTYTAFAMMAVVMVSGLSIWPASYVVAAETSTLHLRGKSQGVYWLFSSICNAIFSFFLPYLYNPDAGNLKAKIGFVFAGFCVIAAALTFWFIPEMKGRTPREIDQMFEEEVPARKFKTWVAGNLEQSPSVKQGNV